MAVPIRRLTPGDADTIATIAQEGPDFDLAGRSESEVPLSPERAAEYLADPNVLHWVAEDDGRVVGEVLCHYLRLPSGAGRELLLYSIGVREAYRRRGIGRALMEVVLDWARQADIPEIWLLADNPGAEEFYVACGYARGGPNEQGVLMIRPTRP
jgi:GNAT superfamily N-acetyltransferase